MSKGGWRIWCLQKASLKIRGVLIPEINLRRPLSEEELSTLSRPTCETLESGLDLYVNTVYHLNNIL
ncbi:UNVERIFIED_CONTAM: hypothetical protein FKN15_017000 [Acipenser sinensis]